MDLQHLLIVLIAFFISSFLKGLTGLGFSTICLGLLAIFMDLKVAIPLVFIPSLISNILVMVQARHFVVSFKRFWLLYLSAVPGLLLGVWLLGNYSNHIPKAVLGTTMIMYSFWGLRNGVLRLSLAQEKRYRLPIGLLSGLVNGMTGSQIMPIMPYLLSLKINRKVFIQTINGAFTLNTLIMMLLLGKMGLLNTTVAGISAAGIVPVALGIYFGGRIQRRVSDDYFRNMVLLLLIVIGLTLLLGLLWAD